MSVQREHHHRKGSKGRVCMSKSLTCNTSDDLELSEYFLFHQIQVKIRDLFKFSIACISVDFQTFFSVEFLLNCEPVSGLASCSSQPSASASAHYSWPRELEPWIPYAVL